MGSRLWGFAAGGSDDEDNLWLSCRVCNSYKTSRQTYRDPVTGVDAPLFDPRRQVWAEHFRWETDGARIEGLTPTGRATVAALQLNNALSVEVRQY